MSMKTIVWMVIIMGLIALAFWLPRYLRRSGFPLVPEPVSVSVSVVSPTSSPARPSSTSTPSEVVPEPEEELPAFSFETVSVGDTLGEGLTVKAIGAYVEAGTLAEKYPPGRKNHSLSLSGEFEVSGTYVHYALEHQQANPKQRFVHFQPDAESRERIPALYDRKRRFLYFTNDAFAKQAFPEPGSSGVATIVVSNYRIREFPDVETDTAELVEVIEIYEEE
jgi:hypothetical protein